MTTTQPTTRLANGDTFPQLTVSLVGGEKLTLPDDTAGSWSVILINRGHWCPFCRTQLTDFQRHIGQLEALGATVVTFSADSESDAGETASSLGVTFPVGFGVDPAATAQTIGNYVSDGSDGHPVHAEATGFLLTPDGTVALAVYSSGAIGRLGAADTIGMLKYITKAG